MSNWFFNLLKKRNIKEQKTLSKKECKKEIDKINKVLNELNLLGESSFGYLFSSIIKIYPNPEFSNEEVENYEYILVSSLMTYLFSFVEENLNYNKNTYFKNLVEENKKLLAFKHIRNVGAHSISGNRNKGKGYKEFNDIMKTENKFLGIKYYDSKTIKLKIGLPLEFKDFLVEILKLKIKELEK